MKAILIEGGSSAAGYHDAERGGWAFRLNVDVLRHNQENMLNPAFIRNLAFPGRTLSGILRNEGAGYIEELAQLKSLGTITTILAVGLNESKIAPGQKAPVMPLKRFEADLELFNRINRNNSVSTIFLGIGPVVDEKTNPTATHYLLKDEVTREYDEVIKEAAAYSEDTRYIDTYRLFMDTGLGQVMHEDGFHPNALGHKVLHQAVVKELSVLSAI